jgi:hypothetical protein
MADVRLGRYEAEEGELPPCCVNCGAPATLFKPRSFTWSPLWIKIAGAWIVAFIHSRRMRMLVPLCEKHRDYWWQHLFVLAERLLILAILVLADLHVLERPVEAADGIQPYPPGLVPGTFVVALAINVAVWLLALRLLRVHTIFAREITDDDITLTGVSDTFAAQLQAERESVDERLRGLTRPRIKSSRITEK